MIISDRFYSFHCHLLEVSLDKDISGVDNPVYKFEAYYSEKLLRPEDTIKIQSSELWYVQGWQVPFLMKSIDPIISREKYSCQYEYIGSDNSIEGKQNIRITFVGSPVGKVAVLDIPQNFILPDLPEVSNFDNLDLDDNLLEEL